MVLGVKSVFLTASVVCGCVWVGGYSEASMGAVGAMHHVQLKSQGFGIFCDISWAKGL